MLTALLELECGDDPAAWAALGFAVHDDAARVGPVLVRFDGRGGGLRGWTLSGAGGPEGLDGIPTAWAAPQAASEGAGALDHVVVLTDDVARTAGALVAAGGDLRRRAGPPAVPVEMAFVRLGPVVVEVATGGAPARLWGLVAVVDDLDALAACLGGRLKPVKPAVQPGRRIAAARPGPGLETAIAFMTPRVRTG